MASCCMAPRMFRLLTTVPCTMSTSCWGSRAHCVASSCCIQPAASRSPRAPRVAGELCLDDGPHSDIEVAALLHDIGKIGIPDASASATTSLFPLHLHWL